MKKIVLLFVLTMVLTFSFVYATDALANPDAIEPAVSGEVIDNTDVDNNVENTDNTDVSGNVSDINPDDIVNEPSADISEDISNNDDDTSTTSKSTVWGAVLAIVIVIIVVALVALFSKND